MARMPKRIAGNIQRRALIPTGPSAVTPSTWVRGDSNRIRVNGPPDGWMSEWGHANLPWGDADNAAPPMWFLGNDNAWAGPNGPHGPDWPGYGVLPPYNGGPIGRYREWGGQTALPYDYLDGQGILGAITRATQIIVGPVIRTTWRYFSGPAVNDISDLRAGPEVLDRPLWVIDPQLVGRIPGGTDARPTIPRAQRLGPHDFWRTALTHALWFGLCAIMYVEDSNGSPLAGTLRIVNPNAWGWDSTGRFVLGIDDEDPLVSDEDGAFRVGPVTWQMRLIRGFSPNDGIVPGGALTRSGLLLSTGTRLNSYLNGILNSGVPSGVLKVSTPNYDRDSAEALKRRWMQSHGGVRRSVAVLNAGVDYQPLQLSVVDADVVSAKGAVLVDLAHAFGLSASWLDASLPGGGNITYANLVDRRRDLLDHSLADWGRSMEDFISAILPFGTSMKIDWAGYLNVDATQGLAVVNAGLDKGFMQVHEARDRLGLTPVFMEPSAPEGDHSTGTEES